MECLYNKISLPIRYYPRRGMLLLKLVCVLIIGLHYSQGWGNRFLCKWHILLSWSTYNTHFCALVHPDHLRDRLLHLVCFRKPHASCPELSHCNSKTSRQGPLQRTVCRHVSLARKLWLNYWHNWMPVCNLVLQPLSFQRSFISVNVGWSPHEGYSVTINALLTFQVMIKYV